MINNITYWDSAMKLNDLDNQNTAIKALKANFDYKFDTSNLSYAQTKTMLTKVNNLIKEAKLSQEFYKNQNDPNYLKLVFMTQALTEHYKNFKTATIVVENQEVEKSQVILAAQDMINSVQKMIEEVNDMLVKELPALTDSIQSEIGVNESGSFNSAASEALTSLNQCLSQSKQTLQGAMNQLTGQGNPEMFDSPSDGGEEIAVTDIGAAAGPDGEEVAGSELDAELPAEEPDLPLAGGVGREKR
jgi:hypothetical protein